MARAFGPATSLVVLRLAIASGVVLLVVGAFYCRDYSLWYLNQFFIDLGERLGGQVTYLGRMAWPNPFSGEHADVFNSLSLHGPRHLMAGCEIFAGVVTLHVLSRLTLPRYKGATLCGRCGYHLAGVTACRCPECGAPCGG